MVLEAGRQQDIQQFSTDPAALSVVLIVDTAIGGTALRRFTNSIVALSSVFITDFDEAAIYRFNSSVTKLSDFTKDQSSFENSLSIVQKIAEKKGDRSDQALVIFPGRGPRW